MKNSTNSIAEHYNSVSKNYNKQYSRENLLDITREYPANYFRLQLLLQSFIAKNIRKVIEIGVGEGTPLLTLGKAGIDIWGVDISQNMVEASKTTMKKNEMNPEQIFWGDIQDFNTITPALKEGRFDALMAMGVMPHVKNDILVLKNMSSIVKPGGSVFVEFRNKLFSLFTFNRYTAEFILDDLLAGVSSELKDIVAKELCKRVEMNLPTPRLLSEDNKSPGYDAILSKFHNPFEVQKMFKELGYTDIELKWYHYHPAMPYLEDENKVLYRNEALLLEHDSTDWRGLFLCSAFVVEAVNKQ